MVLSVRAGRVTVLISTYQPKTVYPSFFFRLRPDLGDGGNPYTFLATPLSFLRKSVYLLRYGLQAVIFYTEEIGPFTVLMSEEGQGYGSPANGSPIVE